MKHLNFYLLLFVSIFLFSCQEEDFRTKEESNSIQPDIAWINNANNNTTSGMYLRSSTDGGTEENTLVQKFMVREL